MRELYKKDFDRVYEENMLNIPKGRKRKKTTTTNDDDSKNQKIN